MANVRINKDTKEVKVIFDITNEVRTEFVFTYDQPISLKRCHTITQRLGKYIYFSTLISTPMTLDEVLTEVNKLDKSHKFNDEYYSYCQWAN